MLPLSFPLSFLSLAAPLSSQPPGPSPPSPFHCSATSASPALDVHPFRLGVATFPALVLSPAAPTPARQTQAEEHLKKMGMITGDFVVRDTSKNQGRCVRIDPRRPTLPRLRRPSHACLLCRAAPSPRCPLPMGALLRCFPNGALDDFQSLPPPTLARVYVDSKLAVVVTDQQPTPFPTPSHVISHIVQLPNMQKKFHHTLVYFQQVRDDTAAAT